MMLIVSLVVFLVIAVVVGWLLRGKSLWVRGMVVAGVSLALFWATSALSAWIGMGVYEFYEVRLGRAPADFYAHYGEYLFWLSLPPVLRPSCESMSALCVLERGYDGFLLGLYAGVFVVVIGVVIMLLVSARSPKKTQHAA